MAVFVTFIGLFLGEGKCVEGKMTANYRPR